MKSIAVSDEAITAVLTDGRTISGPTALPKCWTMERKGADAVAHHVTPAGGNIFEDIGFPAVEAENLKIRSMLMSAIESLIETEGLTQQEAAERLGTTQPRVSDVVRGKINEFSIDSLVNMLTHAGVRVELRIGATRG